MRLSGVVSDGEGVLRLLSDVEERGKVDDLGLVGGRSALPAGAVLEACAAACLWDHVGAGETAPTGYRKRDEHQSGLRNH